MTAARSVLARLVVAAVVAGVVVGVSGIAPLVAPSGGGTIAAGPDHPEYAAERLAPERLETAGQADPSGDVGTVLFDRTHGNRFQNEDVSALTRAIEEAGGDVEFTETTGSLEAELADADVLVVVDPAEGFSDAEVDAVEQFVDDGGRVLLVGEPNRKTVQIQGLAAQLVVTRSELTTVASPFGVSFGSQYLYDMQNNDGNFKNVLTAPPDGTDAAAVEEVDRVALYTAVAVEVNRGTVLLRTADTAERGNEDTDRGFPVAVQTASGDVVAVGDKTFMSEQYHTVGDNDVFLERIVEFMTAADHQPEPPDTPDDGTNATATEEPPASVSADPAG